MYIRKVFLIIKLALVMVLCYLTIKTVKVPRQPGEIFAPSSAIGTEDIHGVEKTSPADTSVKDYSAIIERNIFGSADSPPTADEPLWSDHAGSLLQSAEEELGLALLGTVAGSPAISRAVIKDIKTNEIGRYQTGDKVADASIESIGRDAVVLLHNGQKKILTLNFAQYSSHRDNPQVPSAQIVKRMNETVKNNLSAKQAPTEVQTKTRHIEAMLQKAVIEPYIVNGQIEGLKITGLEKVPVAKELGLRNGDIIRSVNGQRLTSKQKAFQIFMKARTQPVINVDLLRDAKTRKLTFVLR